MCRSLTSLLVKQGEKRPLCVAWSLVAVMAHNHESLSNSGLVAELSVSFRDELTASIQSAFGVAGELAVAQVSKLVGKAFRDVRDQLHKTLLANRNLQTRLSQAHTELRVARSRTQETRDVAVNTTSPMRSESRIDSSLHVNVRHGDASRESYARRTEPFAENLQDGTECAQDVKPNLKGEQCSHQLDETEGELLIHLILIHNQVNTERWAANHAFNHTATFRIVLQNKPHVIGL